MSIVWAQISIFPFRGQGDIFADNFVRNTAECSSLDPKGHRTNIWLSRDRNIRFRKCIQRCKIQTALASFPQSLTRTHTEQTKQTCRVVSDASQTHQQTPGCSNRSRATQTEIRLIEGLLWIDPGWPKSVLFAPTHCNPGCHITHIERHPSWLHPRAKRARTVSPTRITDANTEAVTCSWSNSVWHQPSSERFFSLIRINFQVIWGCCAVERRSMKIERPKQRDRNKSPAGSLHQRYVCVQQFHSQDEDQIEISWAILVKFRLRMINKEQICKIKIVGVIKVKKFKLGGAQNLGYGCTDCSISQKV